MQRDTKTIDLPSGSKAVVHTYLTAKESLEIKSVMMKAMKIDISDIQRGGESVPMKGQIDGTIMIEQEKLLVKFLVKSPESTDDLRESDYNFLVAELQNIRDLKAAK